MADHPVTSLLAATVARLRAAPGDWHILDRSMTDALTDVLAPYCRGQDGAVIVRHYMIGMQAALNTIAGELGGLVLADMGTSVWIAGPPPCRDDELMALVLGAELPWVLARHVPDRIVYAPGVGRYEDAADGLTVTVAASTITAPAQAGQQEARGG